MSVICWSAHGRTGTAAWPAILKIEDEYRTQQQRECACDEYNSRNSFRRIMSIIRSAF